MVESRRELQAENHSRFHAEVCSRGAIDVAAVHGKNGTEGLSSTYARVNAAAMGWLRQAVRNQRCGLLAAHSNRPRFPQLTSRSLRACTHLPGESARDQPSRCGRSGGHPGEGRGRG